MFGLLNLDKPAGMTSRDVVDRVQRLVRPHKVGHAGTLDPIASGVLLVCIGPATRLVPRLHEFSKTYVADFLLGVTSETDDTEVDVRPVPNAPALSAADVERVIPRFLGRIQQVPPAHSAVKVQGRRAYELARRGADVQLAPKEVVLHRIELLEFAPDQMRLEIECSSGTYIRALGRDLGRSLGTGAVMCALRRTRIGPFPVTAGIEPGWLLRETLAEALLPPLMVVEHLPRVLATVDEVDVIRRGMSLQRPGATGRAEEVAVVDANGRLLALAECQADGRVAPRMVFLDGQRAR